ncbi:MAG: S8 family serine peptidase [Chloroflexi bacterium]|uniref:S8 family serine peptidase n=1 Tax=Candidatus Chlorohelix allophototropha TaxID=3003348 RepID=A0A8T7LUR1_9CHLR|nr:S8 family serine peptidase [Chloroflexota bacterium]WJW66512.1 S8 family serine peptidase [Chloroflexota bacterium L227-S17]
MPIRKFKVVFLLLITLLVGLLMQACGPEPTPAPTPEPVPKESKIDTVLLGVLVKYATAEGTKEQKLQLAIDYARQQNIIDNQDEVNFELELNDPTAQKPVTEKVTTMGGRVTNSASEGNIVKLRVKVPVKVFVDYVNSSSQDNYLSDLAGFKGVIGINLLYPRTIQEFNGLPQTLEALQQVGNLAKNEGVKIMQTDKWQQAGFTGKGVRVGIIDGGFKFFQDLQGSYLPRDFNPVDIDKEVGGDGMLEDDVHGSAVSEIIYSHAPDAQYFAAAIDGSDDQFSRAISYMVSQKVNIISISMGGHGTAGDGSSFLEKQIERVRQENGILFVFSAGNEGSSHYTAYYEPDSSGCHQFAPGVTRMALGNPSSAPFPGYVMLNWEQWLNGGINPNATDLDLFITDINGTTLISSTGDQRSRTPKEYVPLKLNPGQLVYIKACAKRTGGKVERFRLHIFSHDLPLQFVVPRIAVADPASSKGALAVGATNYKTDAIEYYSSQGPLTNGVFKPEISAPASVSSGAYEEEGSSNFPGTSAACPQVSGMAAVLKSANPNLSIDDFTTVVLEHVKDLGPVGPDVAFGYGRADAGSNPGAANAKPQGKLPPAPAPNKEPDINPIVIVTLNSRFAYPTPVATPRKVVATTSAGTANTTSAPITDAPITPQPVGNVAFEDLFKDTNSGLPNGGATLYQNGRYSVKATTSQLVWGVYPNNKIQPQSFSAEVSVQGINSDAGLYGLVFWYQNPSSYYLASVTGSGQVQVSQFNNGNWKEILPWTKIGAWKAGASNRFTIQTTDGGLKIFVNNQAVNAQPLKASGSGSIGFAAGSYGGAVEASFTQFRLTTR